MLEQPTTITASQLQMARELFEVASSDPARLQAILDECCKTDRQLRALVEEMIAVDSKPQPILDHPLCVRDSLPDFESTSLAAGARVGSYRIIREIAVGGMGAIYLAELADTPATKQFALKMIRWWSPERSRRFQQEETILRRLKHLNIAQILDSGTTAENSPYIVMEYVEGQPIHSYCQRKALSSDERILLFRQICSAVRYLHQNLVVHRDLKPSNVLVTADGTVKLVDFGIAKLLQTQAGSRSPLNTTFGLMTPNYASPEQVRGVATSTLTDVYSLGILLYELLTGVNPFTSPGIETHEILRRICEEQPEKPSAAVARAGSDPKTRNTLARNLRGELDNIVLKSIRKDPEQRYESVEQFDEDLHRYLNDLPVLAQGLSFSYRTRKFMTRYRTAAVVGVAMFLLLAAGIVATSIEARIADRERARAEAHAQMAEEAKALADRERATAERQTLEAQRQKSSAERRLSELQNLAHGAAQIYASTREGNHPPNGALIAQNSRALLKVLRSEGALDPTVGHMLGELSNETDNDGSTDNSWRVPAGWLAGESQPSEYSIGIDRRVVHGGRSSLVVRSVIARPEGMVYVSQSFRADRFISKRVRLSAFLKPENISNQGFLYLIIQLQRRDTPLRIRDGASGTSGWKRHDLVLDVPTNADSIRIVVELQGAGTLRADDFSFSPVSHSVPLTTNQQPRNLDFTNPTDAK